MKRSPIPPRRRGTAPTRNDTGRVGNARVAPRAERTRPSRSGASDDGDHKPAVLQLPRTKLPRRPRGKENKSRGDLWRHIAGDHGYAVTVYEKRGRRSLYITWWNPNTKRIERDSLEHSNREKAIAQARLLSDELRHRGTSRRGAPAIVTNEYILETYYRERGRHLTGSQPGEHRRRKRLWLGFFASRTRDIVMPEDIDEPLLEQFIRDRRHGDIQVAGIALPEAAPPVARGEKRAAVVEDSTIDADLVYLNAALNWATTFKVAGRKLLAERPVNVPRVKPTSQRQPIAADEDYEALRPVVESVDTQGLLGYWLDLANGLGWRVSGLSAIKAADIDFSPRPWMPHGQIRKNYLVDKENRDDGVPLTKALAAVLRALLEHRGLKPGDDAFVFPTPCGGGLKPWSRWRVRDLMKRAERAAGIAAIGGLHAWRRKWHSERKDYPAQDVANAAGYADVRSVERYRKADPETTYRVMAEPTRRVRRTDPDMPQQATVDSATGGGTPTPKHAYHAPKRRRPHPAPSTVTRIPAAGVGQGKGSAAVSVMPDGTTVHSRDERFAANLAVARAYAAEQGHLMPNKRERPKGVNLLQWLKNQEIRIAKGTMPRARRDELQAIPEWRDRVGDRETTEGDSRNVR